MRVWSNPHGKRWILWGILALTFLLVNIYRLSTAVIADELMAAFQASGTQLGVIHAMFFAVYAVMQIPTGLLVDRIGPRRTAAVGAGVMNLGAIWFSISGSYQTALGARFFIGLGGSVIFVSMLRFAASWFHPAEFAVVNGLSFAVAGLGGVLATTPFAIIVSLSGWETIFRSFAVIGLVLALGTAVFVRDAPENTEVTSNSQSQPAKIQVSEMRHTLDKVVRDRHIWVVAILLFCANGVNLTLFGLWGIPFVAQSYDTSVAFASIFTLFGGVGAALGPPIFGWIGGRTGWRATLVIGGGLCYSGSLAVLTFLTYPPLPFVGLTFFLVGALFGSFVITYPIVKERYAVNVSGIVLGTINGAGFAGAAVFPTAMGGILDAFWTGETVAGARVYTGTGYRLAFGLATLAGVTIVVCGIWLWVQERKNRGRPTAPQ